MGIIMIVWTVIPIDGESVGSSGNSTAEHDHDDTDPSKSSSVAMVLVGVGVAMLLLSVCLGVRSKRRTRDGPPAAARGGTFMDHVAAGQQDP